MDETGCLFRARTGTTWAPMGQTPVRRRISKRRARSTVIGVTLSGHIYKCHFAQAICGDDLGLTLCHSQHAIPSRFIMIWDRLNAHRATVVKEYLGAHPEIEGHWLPPYAPDVNPEEGCHGHVTQHLRNAVPTSVSDLRAGVKRGLARLRRRLTLILGCFRQAGLDVNQLW